jgi:hypothetical protein
LNGRRTRSVLIAYALLQWPWRQSLEDHLYAFRRYGRHTYHYVNLAVPGLARPYSAARYDAIVWHTSFLSWLRWSPEIQHRGLLRRARGLKGRAPVHVALPQDEFLRSDLINAVLTELGVEHVFTVAPPSEWPKIYDGLDRESVGLSRVLTGYLDERTLERTGRILREGHDRTIDIGYRTVPGKAYLGRHAILKAEMAEVVRERAQARGLNVDISTRAEDTFYGDDWYRFLASCRYTIGIEGGASVLDRDGSVRACVESRLEDRPESSFRELEAACFAGRDGEVSLFAISPRHLEACATRTAQVLVEGEYGGILRPDTHYVPLRRDLSNLDSVLDVVAEQKGHAEQMAARAHRDVVASGDYTYRRFVEQVERALPHPGRVRRRRIGASATGALDAASRPLIPLATRAFMPARRRLLGATGSHGYRSGGRIPRFERKRVGGVLVIYDRPITPFHRDASTVVEHASSFARHSRLGVIEVNADSGFPPRLDELEFDAIILHYSLFGMARYRLDEGFLHYLRESGAYKVAFFQDEYFGCQRRFAFLNEYEIDCVYTCLEPHQFEQVYGRYTNVPKLVSTLTGYVSGHLLEAAERFAKPDSERAVDVGYRGRPLPAYLGRGAQEKTMIGERFRELASGRGLRLDIAGAEADRLYGDDWYRFMADCRCLLGVESGASAFDLEGEVFAEYDRLRGDGRPVGVEDLRSLERWDHVVDLRTISPRHFEAAAFRVCPVLFEGRYAGVLRPMRHYIPLAKDFSNLDEVVELIRARDVREQLTENAHRDLIASGRYSYARFVEGVDATLSEAGVQPLSDRAAAEEAVGRGERLRRGRTQVRYLVNGVLGTPPGRWLRRTADPLTVRVRRRLGRPRPEQIVT